MKQAALFNFAPIPSVTEVREAIPLPEYRYVNQAAELIPFLSELCAAPVLAIDTETTGLDPLTDRVRLLQIAAPGLPVLVLDLFHLTELAPVRQVLASSHVKVFQNAKFDLKFLSRAGLEVGGQLFDTMLAGQIVSCGLSNQRHSLEALVANYLKQSLSKTEQVSDWSARELSSEQLRYAALDAAVLLPLREALISKLKAADVIKCAKIEFDCVRAVAEMELAGISLDLDRWEALRKQISTVRDTLAVRLREAFGGGFLGEINLDSPTQVQRALALRGIQVSGTSRWELSRFSDHPEVRLFQEYRKASKLCSAFLDTLPKFIHPQTGRLHPVYEQCLVVSGRFSCHSPNLQQLPHDREFRACFIPAEGHSFVIADYSQIELRVAAQLSQDERMMDAYRANQDLHLLTASLITGKPMGSVTKADRQAAKAVNFGLLYGQGSQGLKSYAKQSYGVDLSLADAERFRDRFFLAYQGIAAWHRQTARNQKKIRETRTLIGRRRLIEKPLELPTLLNLPVQGTAADITKLALAKILPQLAPFGARIVGCIHDEILLETPTDRAQALARLLSDAMEAAGNESLGEVPVVAEASIGQNWAEKG